jgi:5,10-methylenetetrahydrofolate reductase
VTFDAPRHESVGFQGLDDGGQPGRAAPLPPGDAHGLRRGRERLVEDAVVVAAVPKATRVTVTASPTKPLEATLTLAERLAAHGYPVTPHLSARMIHDQAELKDIVARMGAAGITSIFVVGGDSDQVGAFPDAISLLRALDDAGHGFKRCGRRRAR